MILTNMTNYLKNLTLVGGNGLRYAATSTDNYVGEVITGLHPVINTNGDEITSVKASTYQTASFVAPFSYIAGLYLTKTQTGNSSDNTYITKIGFGTGTTPVTESDYQIESIITNNLTFVSSETKITNTYTVNDDASEITRTATLKMAVKNNDSVSVTISEIGFFQSMYSTVYTLLHREVLEEPVTLNSGAIATFEFVFTFINSIA